MSFLPMKCFKVPTQKYSIPVFAVLLFQLFCGGHETFASPGSSLLPPSPSLYKRYQGPYRIDVDGVPRQNARLFLPLANSKNSNWPLIVLLHGYAANGRLQDFYFGLSKQVSKRGFALLIPEGTKNSKGIGFWNATDFCCDFENTQVDDAAYLLSLIAKVKNDPRIDSQRVYLVGHSNGGFMANRLSCEESGDFAGIVNFAGGSYKSQQMCSNDRPTSFLQIHAENDDRVFFKRDPRYGSGSESLANWVRRNNCDRLPEKKASLDLTHSIPGKDTQVLKWNDCQEGIETELWLIESYQSLFHNPHIPFPKGSLTTGILNFLLKQRISNSESEI